MLIVKILQDSDMEDPSDFDGAWKLYSFSRRHRHFADPETIGFEQGGDGDYPNIGLRRKLATGTAFMLSYFEHGRCSWGLRGSMDGWPDMRWDGVRTAGILICDDPRNMGAKTYEDRARGAAAFLETYTAWCNGDGYGFLIEDPAIDEDTGTGTHIDSCFGFYGNDAEGMAYPIAEAVVGQRWELDDSEAGSPYGLEDAIRRTIAIIQSRTASETIA